MRNQDRMSLETLAHVIDDLMRRGTVTLTKVEYDDALQGCLFLQRELKIKPETVLTKNPLIVYSDSL